MLQLSGLRILNPMNTRLDQSLGVWFLGREPTKACKVKHAPADKAEADLHVAKHLKTWTTF